MKKWSIAAGAIVLALLLGTLVLLGCYFFSDLSAVFSGQPTTIAETTLSVTTTFTDTTSTQETTSAETTSATEESTVPEDTTLPEETTEATTIPETTAKPTSPPPTTTPTTAPTDPPPTTEAGERSLSAKYAFVYDLSAGTYLYNKGDAQAQVAPASITKLFTAYVALQHMDPATVITVGNEINKIAEGSSRAWLSVGHRISVEMCIEGMLLPSGNDAAYVLAVAAGRAIQGDASLGIDAALDVFMDEVNRQAQALGLTGTHFVTPDGTHRSSHYTTLDDLLTIARLSLNNAIISKYTATQQDSVTFASGHTITWKNSNKLLDPGTAYYCAEAIGLKTGSTSSAGNCLLSAFRKDGSYIVICVIGCSSDADRYEDTLYLYEQYA